MKLALLLLLLLVSVAAEIRTPATEGVIEVVSEEYHRSCVLILYSESEVATRAVVDLLKFLSSRRRLAAAASVQSVNWTVADTLCFPERPPLCVVLSSDAATHEFLKAVSDSMRFSGPAWLLFLPEGAAPARSMERMYSPFNSRVLLAHPSGADELLVEVYHVAKGWPPRTFPYGNWSETRGAEWSRLSLHQRRGDLEGAELRIAVLHSPPVVTVTEDQGVIGVGGFFGDVWCLLQERLNFTSNYLRQPDASWGVPTGAAWSGMMGIVQRGEAQVALAEFSMTSIRAAAVEFSVPLMSTTNVMWLRGPTGEGVAWSDFLAPFSRGLWMTVALSNVFLAAQLWALYRLGVRGGAEKRRCSFRDALQSVFAAFCQQGQDEVPSSLACRIVFLAAYLTAVILLAAYSAALISFLTRQTVTLPFEDFPGLLRDRSYRLAVLNQSSELLWLQDSTNPTLMAVAARVLPYQLLPRSTHESLQQLCHKRKYVALLPYDLVLGILDETSCDLVSLPKESQPIHFAMPMAKGSPYNEAIDYHLQVLRDKGVLKRLRAASWRLRMEKYKQPWTEVNVSNITPIMCVLLGGGIGALVLLLAECRFMRRRKQARKRRTIPAGAQMYNFFV